MKTYFMNNGDFDVRAMLTMGVSAKGSDDAIGYFGTGFKYAVAIVLRLGGSIKISTVSGVYNFTAKKEMVRGKEFEIVYCNDREAGFTTRLGVNWKPWMAFRELYCNAKDEGGEISDKICADYDTVIEVECVDIFQAFCNKQDYFITDKPIHSHGQCDIHKGGKPFIYFRGIAVAEAYGEALYSYNVKSFIELTEDRTAKYEHQLRFPIQKALQSVTSTSMLREFLRGGKHAEANIGFDEDWPISDEFVGVCQSLSKTDLGISEAARLILKKVKQSRGDWPEFELSPVQRKMLDKAKRFLAAMDVDCSMFPIKTVVGLGEGVMGRAMEGVIYLSEMPFNMGTKQVASTLLEEWVHNKTGAADFDRVMQSWLFDKILTLGENINGEPL